MRSEVVPEWQLVASGKRSVNVARAESLVGQDTQYAPRPGMDDEFETRCERVIIDEALSALSDGRATLRRIESENGDWFELAPASKRACLLVVMPNGPGEGELTLGPGRNESWFEVWGSPDETVDFLRKVIEAVIAGHYEEYIKRSKAIGRLQLRDGPYVFRDNTMFARWPPSLWGWNHETYDPY